MGVIQRRRLAWSGAGVGQGRLPADAGVPLRERLPVYDRYVDEEWLSARIHGAIEADSAAGRRYRACLAGERLTNP